MCNCFWFPKLTQVVSYFTVISIQNVFALEALSFHITPFILSTKPRLAYKLLVTSQIMHVVSEESPGKMHECEKPCSVRLCIYIILQNEAQTLNEKSKKKTTLWFNMFLIMLLYLLTSFSNTDLLHAAFRPSFHPLDRTLAVESWVALAVDGKGRVGTVHD